MDDTLLDEVTGWESRPVADGYAGLQALADEEFTGAVEAGRTYAFLLNGRVVGVVDGAVETFDGASLSAYVAPDESLPLLFAMRAGDSEPRARYFTDDTPLSEADATLSSGQFTGYIELSENVLSGDYYVVYYGGRSLPVAFVGNNRRLVAGEEAFELADDEVGIYEVREATVDVVDVPNPRSDAGSGAGAGPGSRQGSTTGDGAPAPGDDESGRDSDRSGTGASTPGTPDHDGRGASADPAPGDDGVDVGGGATDDDGPGAGGRPDRPSDAVASSRDARGQPDPGPDPTGDGAEKPDAGRDHNRRRDADDGAGDGPDGSRPDIDLEGSLSGRRPSGDDTAADGSSTAGGTDPSAVGTGGGPPAEPSGNSGTGAGGDTGVYDDETDGGDESVPETDPEPARDPAPDPGEDPEPVAEPDRGPTVPDDGAGSTESPDRTGGATASEAGRADDVTDSGSGPEPAGGGGPIDDGTGDGEPASGDEPPRSDAGDAAPVPGGESGGHDGDDPYTAEERWREERVIPALDPDSTGTEGDAVPDRHSDAGPAAPDDEDREDSGDGGHDRPAPGERSEAEDAPTGGASAPVGRLRERVEELEAELAEAAERRQQLADERAELERERDEAVERAEELARRIEDLEAEVRRLESDLAAARQTEAAAGAAVEVTPADALAGAHLFVRYGTTGGATLSSVLSGESDREAVTDNLRVEYHHTQFDAGEAVVDGRPFAEFLEGTVRYQFVEWVVSELLFEVLETGNGESLDRLVEAIPESDRAELEGAVTVPADDSGGGEHRSLRFDVVVRDRMGNPLVVADLNESRDAATDEQMADLVEKAEAVGRAKEQLAAAFLVTSSFFDPAALERANAATDSGGILGGSSRRSYVKLSRRNGFHLCLVETRDGSFHLNVPEL